MLAPININLRRCVMYLCVEVIPSYFIFLFGSRSKENEPNLTGKIFVEFCKTLSHIFDGLVVTPVSVLGMISGILPSNSNNRNKQKKLQTVRASTLGNLVDCDAHDT